MVPTWRHPQQSHCLDSARVGPTSTSAMDDPRSSQSRPLTADTGGPHVRSEIHESEYVVEKH
eukprot:CAMPEP_0119295020 /NCGR_PEP_ID=MMETSP1329-20130426/49108_1 /TAXON_ID=114041 /ORGANISM="Genus nov. species nov., Strain RCC1024" /LENGTH=61 /DNA_ID=CAMNT_0007295931 /DNA_START=67 /DNA_END=249 /DNA_ORIENTATION=-